MVRRIAEPLLLLILIGIVALRPLVAERYDAAESSLTAALGGISDPSPLRTLAFDAVIAACAVACFVNLAVRRRGYRPTGLEGGLLLITAAVIVSCLFAGNQRLAINASIDWLCAPLLAITLVQLFDDPRRRRVLSAAVLASGCVVAVQCLEEYFVQFTDTQRHYESIKGEFWARQGVELDSQKVALFEGRLKAREASGPFPHSSIAGSYLALCTLAASGVAASAWRVARRAHAGVTWLALVAAAALVLLLAAGVAVTKSLGAGLAALIALCAWVVVASFRGWVQRHPRGALALGWLLAAMGIAGGVGYGLYHRTLPGTSLMFRWQYWQASTDLVQDHWLTGVGRENFGRHYLQYKSIRSPEEVANPHNLFVHAAAEWGVLGLAGLIVMLIGASKVVTQGQPHQAEPSSLIHFRFPEGWMLVLGLVVLIGRVTLLGSSDFNFLYYVGGVTLLAWLAGFVAVAAGTRHTVGTPSAPLRMVTNGALFGLLAFLVHDLINFALFVPGTLTTAFALFAGCAAERCTPRPETRRSGFLRWAPASGCAAFLAALLAFALVPSALRAHWAGLARPKLDMVGDGPLAEQPPAILLQKSAAADPWDPTPLVEQARWALRVSVDANRRDEALRLAIESLERAIERDRYQLALWRMRVAGKRALAESTGKLEDYEEAAAAARAALRLYPQDPEGLILLGDCLASAGSALRSVEALEEANRRYRQAIQLDDMRLEWETLRRLRPRQRAEIEARIDQVERLLER